MLSPRLLSSLSALILAAGLAAGCANMPCNCGSGEKNAFAPWKNGPASDASFFPIAVWLQDPADAEKYKAAGINTYVGLWEGPTEEQLADLKKAGIGVFVEQNAVALKHLNDPTIVGWMHGDEPDNAQSSPGKDAQGKPLPNQPIPPSTVIDEYHKYQQTDPTRPIMLNLGQGVANDTWPGRGKDNGNLEVYKEYVKSGDIISFDIYPVSGNRNPDRGNLAQEAKGIDRLKAWTGGKKIIWNCIECTQINSDRPDQITPQQMQSCVWISLVHGSKGIIYFCHQFGSKGASAKHLLLDPPMLAAATQVNKQIHDLAPVLNAPNVSGIVEVTATVHAMIPPPPATPVSATLADMSQSQGPIDTMVKKQDGATYVFACGMTRNALQGTFHVKGLPAMATADVYGESRTITVKNGEFQDDFAPFGHHCYIIKR